METRRLQIILLFLVDKKLIKNGEFKIFQLKIHSNNVIPESYISKLYP